MEKLKLSFDENIGGNQGGHLVLIDLPGMFIAYDEKFQAALDKMATENGNVDVTVFNIDDRRDYSVEMSKTIAAAAGMGGISVGGYFPAVKQIFNVASGSLSPDSVAVYAQTGLRDRNDLLFQAYEAAYENDPATIVTGIKVQKKPVDPGTTIEKVITNAQGQNLLAKWHVVSANTPEELVEGILKAVQADAEASLSASAEKPSTGLGWKVPAFKA